MSGNRVAAAQDRIPIRIELSSALADFAHSPHVQQLERRLESELDVLLDRIDLAGTVDVQFTVGDSSRLARIHVHDRLLPYSPELLRRAWLAVSPPDLHDLPDAREQQEPPGFAAAWLRKYAHPESGGEPPDLGLLAAFVERFVVQAVLDRPSCLLGSAQLTDYGTSLTSRPSGLASVAATLLDLGVSLEDRELVNRILKEGEEIGRPLEDTIEALFTELRPHRIEILVHPETLAKLVPGSLPGKEVSIYDGRIDQTRRKLFRDFEKAFFSAFGFVLPSMVWVPSGAMSRQTVAVRIGTWRSLPVPMPQGRLVLAPSAALPAGIEAKSSFDPVSGLPCSIVAADDKEEIEAHGFTTWGPVDFTLIILGSELSRRAAMLLGMEEIEYQLAHLSAEPEQLLTDTAVVSLTRFSLGDLTRVMRALVAERLSMLDLSGLLERLVQYQTLEVEPELGETIVFGDRLPTSANADRQAPAWRSYYAFLRRRLQLYLSYFYGGADKQILAYSLEPEVEELVGQGADNLDDERLEAFRDGVWEALSKLAPSAVIITTTEARHAVRDALAPEFPDLPVLARSEIAPSVELQSLARIGFATRQPRTPVGSSRQRLRSGGQASAARGRAKGSQDD